LKKFKSVNTGINTIITDFVQPEKKEKHSHIESDSRTEARPIKSIETSTFHVTREIDLPTSTTLTILHIGTVKFICLDILPDYVDDRDVFCHVFVKPYSMKRHKEPTSYNQIHGLETNYPYIERVMVTTALSESIIDTQRIVWDGIKHETKPIRNNNRNRNKNRKGREQIR
jgi:hypothetical protein